MDKYYIIYLVKGKVKERLGKFGNKSEVPFDNKNSAYSNRHIHIKSGSYSSGILIVRTVDQYKEMLNQK